MYNNISIYAFADEAGQSLEAQIQAMQRNGLDGLEIRNVDGVNVSDLTVEKAGEIREQMDRAGLKVWSIGSPIGKISIEDDFSAHLEVFKNTLRVASILGAQRIRLFSFYIPAGKDPAAYRDEVITRMKAFVEVAQGSGILLCHENEKGIYGDIADRCLDLLQSVPELHAIFDPANFIQCGQETLEAWEKLGDRIDYLHIKDALSNGKVVPAGKGEGNLPQILSAFKSAGGTAVTVEPHLFDFAGLKALENSNGRSVVGDGHYASPDAAFDAAVAALKQLLSAM